ncbi:LacI family DNA-binding transcriptional regulator [Paenibacillus lignilyticus]|uniref:LacI family DNA-binding transcriptional regulator n=1 Tax=Paenibacillus lignilyticus TaxID=1172615 RepID=A0ABS5CEN8_9BACL|nr:LacI family DNA-binding transcriptional regulator [Paenibacillus lignilyticus]MBP3964010.1 LacI family DNA-binding transcriptional regulator [Paenibacillus lignilyticus]
MASITFDGTSWEERKIKKPTIHDVAEKAKVTPSTVSRVMNGSSLVKPITRQRVLDAVKSLGYIPSKTARMFKSGKSGILGLVVSAQHISELIFNAGFQAIFKALTEKAHSEGYNILILTSSDPDSESFFNVIKNQVADGFIILSPSNNESLASMLEEAGIPYVFNMKYSNNPEDIYYITSDDLEAGYMAAKYLLDLNHTDIRFIVGSIKGNVISFNHERINGVKKAYGEYGIPFKDDYIVRVPGQMEESYNRIHQLLQTQKPTALMISNEVTTVAALNYFYDYGYRVPQDISVIGFGPSDLYRSLRPNLTSVSFDITHASGKIVDMLLQRIEGIPIKLEPPKKPELIIRDSTARNI